MKHSEEKEKRLFRCCGFYDDFCLCHRLFFIGIAFFNRDLIKKLPIDTKTIVLERLTDYKPLVEEELESQGLSHYTSLILGMMYQESKGKGNDPMQSSESLGLKRNEITDLNSVLNKASSNLPSCTRPVRKKVWIWIPLFKATTWGQVTLIL